jgi:hypothetical protein
VTRGDSESDTFKFRAGWSGPQGEARGPTLVDSRHGLSMADPGPDRPSLPANARLVESRRWEGELLWRGAPHGPGHPGQVGGGARPLGSGPARGSPDRCGAVTGAASAGRPVRRTAGSPPPRLGVAAAARAGRRGRHSAPPARAADGRIGTDARSRGRRGWRGCGARREC